jgi:hypothetical protein
MVPDLISVFVASQVGTVAREVGFMTPLLQEIIMTTQLDIVDVMS